MGESNRQFQVQVKLSSTDGIPLVVLEGECDAFTAPFTHGAVSGLIDAGYKGIIIDLTNLTYMDGAGFHSIDDCCIRMKEVSGNILLVNPGTHVEEIYDILRERESCTIVDTIDEALLKLQT